MTWQTLSSRVAYRNPWITVREDDVLAPDGSPAVYGVVELRDSVFVVALTDDDQVVRALVRDARPDLALLPAPMREERVALQVRAQRRQRAEDHPGHREELVLLDDRVVGRLVVAEYADSVELIDLSVAVADRGRGIARRVLGDLFASAGERTLRLGVHPDNLPALRLYESLGFRPTGASRGDRCELECRPGAQEEM